MKTDTDSVSLVIESTDGRPLRAYSHEGKTFVESHETRAYQLRVKNKTGGRVKAVIAVDSLNILTGKPASDDPNETGYILGPYAEEVFRGWRLDDNQVAAFTFVKREKSYATEKGEGQGNGVIAVRVYAEKDSAEEKLKRLQKQFDEWIMQPREKEYIPYPVYLSYPVYPYWRPYWERPYYDTPFIYCKSNTTQMGDATWTATCTSNGIQDGLSTIMNCSMDGTLNKSAQVTSQSVELRAQNFDMGSSWGGLVKETVTHTAFETGTLIAELSVFYASIEGLKSMGIDTTRSKQVVMPEPFKRGYCQPPAGWSSGKA